MQIVFITQCANKFDWNFSILNCGLNTFVKNNGSSVDSEIGILSYLSFIQDAQLKIVLTDMIEVCQQFEYYELKFEID